MPITNFYNGLASKSTKAIKTKKLSTSLWKMKAILTKNEDRFLTSCLEMQIELKPKEQNVGEDV